MYGEDLEPGEAAREAFGSLSTCIRLRSPSTYNKSFIRLRRHDGSDTERYLPSA